MNKVPVAIKRLKEGERGAGLDITWSDGARTLLASQDIRKHCPCATCQEKRGTLRHDKPLTPKRPSLRIIEHTLDEETDLRQVFSIGNYAIGIRWGDGHDSGIYSFQTLEEIASTHENRS